MSGAQLRTFLLERNPLFLSVNSIFMLIFALELIERLNGYDLDCTRGHYGE